MRGPHRDNSILKSFDEVCQDNTPYVACKEPCIERSIESIDLRLGVQRFSWGRLDEYPVNDLFNPWDYTRFIGQSGICGRSVGKTSAGKTCGS